MWFIMIINTKFFLITLILIIAGCSSGSDKTNDLLKNNPDPNPGNNSNVNNAGSVAISGTVTVGETLTATVSDADGITSTISYVWKADNVVISGVTSNTYLLTQAEVGLPITVTASYIDDGFTAENPVSDPTAAVTNVNSAGSVAISGTASEGETLTATVS